MKKLALLLLFAPFISSAQPPFVVHMPFHGDPLFCHETGCLRKAAIAKTVKKNRHKRRVAARKSSRKEKDKKVIESAPTEERLRPKFE